MSREDTMEVDPSELSDEVREELIDDAYIDPDEAKKFAKKVQLKQMNFTDPKKNNIINLKPLRTVFDILNPIRRKAEYGFNILGSIYNSFLSEKNARPVISKIEPTDDNSIVLQTEHPKLDDHKIHFTQDDKKISNLMAYYKVDNPTDLENKRLVIDEIRSLNSDSQNLSPSHWREVRLLIPNNTSFLGRVRYKLFSLVQDVRSKTNIQTENSDGDVFAVLGLLYFALFFVTVFVGYGGGLIIENTANPLLIGIGTFMILPLFLIILIGISAIVWRISQLILLFISYILKGDFHKVRL